MPYFYKHLYYRVRQISFVYLENALKNYWMFSEISFFISKYNLFR